MRKRMKIRTIAKSIKVSVSVVQRMLRDSVLKRTSNKIHPQLSAKNKVERVKFAMSHVEEQANGSLLFDELYDVVHVDEKWFNEDVDRRTFYLVDGEEPPHRQRRSKRFIGKTMFLCAVARPR